MAIVHHHLLYQAHVGKRPGEESEESLRQFMYGLIREIGMQCLIPPQLRLSHQRAWTGIMGLITSHISFHYWTVEGYVQLDIYSCKEFDVQKTVTFLNRFWCASDIHALFINRETGREFEVKRLSS